VENGGNPADVAPLAGKTKSAAGLLPTERERKILGSAVEEWLISG
jgi:hypothetical protein